MNLLANLSEMMGLTILHSLWQITLLWMVLITVLKLWPRASSATRYTLALSALVLCMLTTAATAIYEWPTHATSVEDGVAPAYRAASQTQPLSIAVEQTFLSRTIDGLNASVPIVAWLWCAGLAVMGARFGGSFFYLQNLRAPKNIAAPSPVWQQEVNRLSLAVGLRGDVTLGMSTRISSPVTLGNLSPIILLPAGLLSALSTAQLETILVHELYHIKRHDYVVNLCQAWVEVLLFYHPALWHINTIIREERENCCDDCTLAFCGDAMAYARALTQLQENKTITKPTLAMSATGTHSGKFSHRIKRLFNSHPNPAQTRSKGIFSIGFLMVYLGILLVGAQFSTARPAEPEKNSTTASVNDHHTLRNIFSDSIISNPSDVPDNAKIIPRLVSVKKIRSINTQLGDTSARQQSLEECLKKSRLLLKMMSIYGPPGNRFNIGIFSSGDSLRIAGRPTLTLFKELANPSTTLMVNTIDTTGNETAKAIVEKMHRSHTDSVSREASMEELNATPAVHVFPNATHERLSIRFTPTHDNTHVTMVLLGADGKVVEKITDSTYDHVPATLDVDVSRLKKGVYILQVNLDGATSQQRVVVE